MTTFSVCVNFSRCIYHVAVNHMFWVHFGLLIRDWVENRWEIPWWQQQSVWLILLMWFKSDFNTCWSLVCLEIRLRQSLIMCTIWHATNFMTMWFSPFKSLIGHTFQSMSLIWHPRDLNMEMNFSHIYSQTNFKLIVIAETITLGKCIWHFLTNVYGKLSEKWGIDL